MNRVQTKAYKRVKRAALQAYLAEMHTVDTLIYNLQLSENKGKKIVIIAGAALYKRLGKSFKGIPVEPIWDYPHIIMAGAYSFLILDAD